MSDEGKPVPAATMTLRCGEIRHGSADYRRTVALRNLVLRRPLGLELKPGDLPAERGSHHLACWRGRTLAACLILTPVSGTTARLRQFAVSPALQGQGIGRALMAFAEDFARQRGYREIVMHARVSAEGFYRKLGYRAEGRRFTEVTLPHRLMRKALKEGRPSAIVRKRVSR